MRRPEAALILIISSLMTVPAIAGPYEDASNAYKHGDYKTSFRIIKPLAEQGLTKAQFDLGAMYDNGEGVPQNFAEAMKWYRKAADQGHATALLNLGVMFTIGHGVPQDYAEAMKWFRKAADQGDASAQYNLGGMYYKGQGVRKDYAEAVKWFGKAADQGEAIAMRNLGVMYESGEGVRKDYVMAHMWFNLAASRNPSSEIGRRNENVKDRDNLASKMTPAQIAEAQKLALEWKSKKGRTR